MRTDIIATQNSNDLAASVELNEQPFVEVLAGKVSVDVDKLGGKDGTSQPW